MRRMRPGVAAALLVSALVLAGATTADARVAAGSAAFEDPASDSGAAPDVTTVTVANDDQGLLTFRITVPNRSVLGPGDAVAVLLGTDDPDLIRGKRGDGMNFILGIDDQGVFLLRWNGADMDEVKPHPSSVSGSFSGGVATLTVKQEHLAPGFPDLSLPIAMDFYVLGVTFNGTDVVAQDEAPDGSTTFWSYKIAEALRVVVTNFDADKTVKAGKTLTVLMGAAHGDTGTAINSGTIRCNATLGGKPLKGSGHFLTVTVTSPTTDRSIESPNATCSWKVPKKNAKGKVIRGSVSLTESGITVSRSFTTRIR